MYIHIIYIYIYIYMCVCVCVCCIGERQEGKMCMLPAPGPAGREASISDMSKLSLSSLVMVRA